MGSQTVIFNKKTSLHYTKEHNFLLFLSVLNQKDKSTGEEPECCWRRCSSCCLNPRLAAFPPFSEAIDKKYVQTQLPQLIYCALLNFPLLRSLNRKALCSRPLPVTQPNTLTFCSSAVIEEHFLGLESSCRISVTDLHDAGDNPGGPCLSALYAGLVWGGLVALFARV